MNIKMFDALMAALPDRGALLQETSEWKAYLEFVCGYFQSREILMPLVVEIGAYRGATRAFYEQLLGAEYISIDVDPFANPDIAGDSGLESTYNSLKERIGGRMIDLLFIDGDHSYAACKLDYINYSPLTQHIIAIHDITKRRDGREVWIEVYKVWDELMAVEDTITFKGRGWVTPGLTYPLGIGVVLK